MSSSSDDAEPARTHLVVLIHGFMGHPRNVTYLAGLLRERVPRAHVHCVRSISFGNTARGVGAASALVQEELLATRESGEWPASLLYLSFVGVSLGGLVARQVAGELLARADGADARRILGLVPLLFVTIASPHLGITDHREWFGWHAFSRVSWWQNTVQDLLLQPERSGRDTQDAPLLLRLVDPRSVYMRALALFQRRALYGNAVNDELVSCASALAATRRAAALLREQAAALGPAERPSAHVALVLEQPQFDERLQRRKDRRELERLPLADACALDAAGKRLWMVAQLNAAPLQWERAVCEFSGAASRLTAHLCIFVCFPSWLYMCGDDVVQHVVGQFLRPRPPLPLPASLPLLPPPPRPRKREGRLAERDAI